MHSDFRDNKGLYNDQLMYIPNDDTKNYLLCRLQLVVDTQLNEPTNQNSI